MTALKEPLRADRLDGVLPALVFVVKRATLFCERDIIVVEGVRTPERQAELYALGRTTEELLAANIVGAIAKPEAKKVTWTMKSRHLKQADGYAYAVDLAPIKDGVIQWNDLAGFDAIALAMFRAASQLGVRIRWGADWDGDGRLREKGESDSPHFEIARQA